MKRWPVLLFAAIILCLAARAATAADPSGFVNCGKTIFADCTTATCDPNTYQCICHISGADSGVSTTPGCISATTSDGRLKTAQSRYAPVPTTGLCNSQTTAWAQCLGVVCQVSPDGQTTSCPCTKATAGTTPRNDPYVIVTANPIYAGQCKNGVVYSSATFYGEVAAISKALGFKMPNVLWQR